MNHTSLPIPNEPWNIANLRTIPWLEEMGWKGLGDDLEESLFQQGGAWLKLESPDPAGNTVLFLLVASEEAHHRHEIEFVCVGMQPGQMLPELYPDQEYWGPRRNQVARHEPLDSYEEVQAKFMELVEEFGWPEDLAAEDEKEPYPRFTIRVPRHRYGIEPAPGETVDDYYERLLWGDEDGNDHSICPDFLRDVDAVWFVRGGSECFGEQLCQWHKDMDAIYAAGSSTIAGYGVPLDVLKEAIRLMDQRATAASYDQDEPWCPARPYDAAHARALSAVMKAALEAKPSEEVQSYE
jgi:hypothetical protein